MYPERPNIDEFLADINSLADLQAQVNNKKYQLSKLVAKNIRRAIKNGAKTKEIDYIKVVGNDEDEEKQLDKLNEEVHEGERAIRVLWGSVEAWKAKKELYKTDSYHDGTGKISFVPKKES